MARLIYSLLLTIAAPFLLYGLYKKKQGKPPFGSRWIEHFGFVSPLASDTHPIWIHAVSVGESIAAINIIKQIKQQYPEIPIVVTTTTSTGAQQIEKLGNLVEHRYMPIDFSFTISQFLKVIKPKVLLIMETELWPNTLHTVAKNNIPCIVLNARLSQRSFLKYKKVLPLFRSLSKNIQTILCQDSTDLARFAKLGVSAEKLKAVGSIKFDLQISEHVTTSGKELKRSIGSRPIWIAASTHQGEDEQIIEAHKSVLESLPDTLLILVPRHPERFSQVISLVEQSKLTFATRSQTASPGSSMQVYIGDTMGELLSLLAASDVCFMGGSLAGEKVGGHNILEPAALGIPIITGNSYYNFQQITDEMRSANIITICQNSSELADYILQQLIDIDTLTQEYQQLRQNLISFVQQKSGATARTIDAIREFI